MFYKIKDKSKKKKIIKKLKKRDIKSYLSIYIGQFKKFFLSKKNKKNFFFFFELIINNEFFFYIIF